MEKKNSSLTWAETIILKALHALKIVFVEKKNNVTTTCREKKLCCGEAEEK